MPWDEDEDLGLNDDSAHLATLKAKPFLHGEGGGGDLLHPEDRPTEDEDEGTVSDPSPSPQVTFLHFDMSVLLMTHHHLHAAV